MDNFITEHNPFCEFHKDTLAPDELFFHTIIKHLSQNNKRIKIKHSLTYVNWSRENTQLPVLFNKNDYKELINQTDTKLFARKFDMRYCKTILDIIDSTLLFNPLNYSE